jgi:hypothetical protein
MTDPRTHVAAAPPTFHLQIRLLTSLGTVGPWAGHVFRVQVGRPAAPAPRRGAAPLPPRTEWVYGVVSGQGLVDALLPADWEAATLDIGDALGSGSPANPAPSFGAARLSIPLEAVPPQEEHEEERPPPEGDPALRARARVARVLRMSATIGVALANLGFVLGEVEALRDGAALANAVRHAIRSYVFRQLNRRFPVAAEVSRTLIRVMDPGAAGEEALGDEDVLGAVTHHVRRVHNDIRNTH